MRARIIFVVKVAVKPKGVSRVCVDLRDSNASSGFNGFQGICVISRSEHP